MTRSQLVNLHLILAALLLPAILMFAVTGGLYTWGVKGSYDTQDFKIPLEQPLKGDLASLVHFAQNELDKQNKSLPSGGAKLKSDQFSHKLEWTGSQLDINLTTAKNSKIAILEVKQPTFYRSLVQLHKAKGGTAFKIYAALLAACLILLLISGLIMAWNMPKYRLKTLLSLGLGLTIWALMVNFS